MADIPQRVALVYDRMTKWGGAERVLLVLHELFPKAPLYTSIYNFQTAPWAKVFPHIYVGISFLHSHHELVPWLMPLAFEHFDFSNYDLVISITSESAKGIITKPGTKHICYCLTPTRYLYSHGQTYLSNPLFHLVAKYLRYWDQIAAHRPDYYLAISKTVQNRIQKYYSLPSEIVYPPVDTDFFTPATRPSSDYFLVVSRLVEYKNINQLISVFNSLTDKLIIVGCGSLKLQKYNPNTKLVGQVSDEQLRDYYQNCKALVFMHEEDFGLVPLEAQACGKPVIALNIGGATETVIPGKTGVLLDSIENLPYTITSFNVSAFDPVTIRNHALKFSQNQFKKHFIQTLGKLYPS